MTQDPPGTQTRSQPKPATWLDMALYLVGGFGLLLLASFGAGLIFTETSILASLTFYLLDFFILCGTVYVLGVRRGKLTWEEMGFLPPKVQWQRLLMAVVASSFVLGVANALLYERSRSIWIPIAMHILTNGVAVTLMYAALAVLKYFPMLGM